MAISLLTTNISANSRTKGQLQQVGVLGLLLLVPVTAVEAGLAVKRVRETS